MCSWGIWGNRECPWTKARWGRLDGWYLAVAFGAISQEEYVKSKYIDSAGNRWSLEQGSLYSNPWCSQYISHCSRLPPALRGLCSAITGYHGQTLTWRHCSSFTSNLWCEEWLEMVLLLKVRLFIARCSCCFQSMSHTGTARNSLYSILFVSIYLKCWVFGIGVHSSWFIFVHFSMRYKTLSLNIMFLFNPVLPRKNFWKNKGRRKKHPKNHKRKNSYP